MIRCLGVGANGEVYLVRGSLGLCAMKIHHVAGDIALEWGILEKLGHSSGYFPEPIIIDDCITHPLYFYTMSWIDGQSLDRTIHKQDGLRIRSMLMQILCGLHDLHQIGHAFCDIKPQNILIERKQGAWTVRFVDVGGITPFGRSVRQFTPYYDRAFWGLGTRNADAHYDLCSVVLMFVCLFSQPPKNLAEQTDEQRTQWLSRAVHSFPIQTYVDLFQMVLVGNLSDTQTFLNRVQTTSIENRNNCISGKQNYRHSKPLRHARDWTERLMWISLSFAAIAACAAWATFLGWF